MKRRGGAAGAVALSCVLSVLAAEARAQATNLEGAVARPFLPAGADMSSWSMTYRRVAELDAAADAKWRALRTREEYDAYRTTLREKMLKALGPFPKRTPLNFRSVRTFKCDGYRIEHVIYESMPGLLVPAHLFVPDEADAKKPLPAVVLSCGHGDKDCMTYRRACVDMVRRGFVTLMFEPYEQGERVQYPEYNCCQNHNLIGLKAMLLGSSMAALRLWDGIRAIDCVEALPYVDRERIGYAGQSGGGTMTALMTAVDLRLKATAPSCYLTNFGFLFRTMGAQDGEQNVFGQLAFGLNHTGYVLIPDTKVAVTGRYNDMFDYGGTAQLMTTVRTVASMLGAEDHYSLNFSSGPHGWTESTMQASADWMCAWLKGEKEYLPIDMPRLRRLDYGYDVKSVELGLKDDECRVLGGKGITDFSGARDVHAVFRAWLAQAKARRRARTAAETDALAARLAVVRRPHETGAKALELGVETVAETRVTRFAFAFPDGFALPGVLLERSVGRNPSAAPVLLSGTKGRVALMDEAERALADGASVLLLDVTGVGEIGKPFNIHYGSTDTPEEDVSIMLYLMGESMPGRRATDLLVAADWLKVRTGRPVALVAEGSVAVAAAHAVAADRSLFASVRPVRAPASWTEFLEKPGVPLPYRYTFCVNGALKEYDWTELLPSEK